MCVVLILTGLENNRANGKTPFSHIHPVVIGRLRCLPNLLKKLPWDPDFEFSENHVFLHRTHTSNLDHDMTCRQGPTNLVTKVTKMAAESQLNAQNAYLASSREWQSGLYDVVGDHAWGRMSVLDQIKFSELRGELLFFLQSDGNWVSPIKSFKDCSHFGFSIPSTATISARVLEVFESRRPMRMQQMCNVECRYSLKIDFCKYTGQQLGGGKCWQVLLTNEDDNLVASQVTPNTSLKDLIPWFQQMRYRINPKIINLDNVPPQDLEADGRVNSKLQESLRAVFGLPSVDYIIQDRFHVQKRMSSMMNHTDPRFHYVLLKFRDATVKRDQDAEQLVEAKLKHPSGSLIARKVTFQGVVHVIKQGDVITQHEIDMWKVIPFGSEEEKCGNIDKIEKALRVIILTR